MLMPFARRSVSTVRCLILGMVSLTALATTGCSEEFSDEKFGVLDLAKFYDGGTRLDPAAGVPTEINASAGFVGGQAAEIYDFGLVPAIRNGRGAPISVLVQPMYFFFDKQARPLFSRPIRELRDGTDWMKGGKRVLNPNPKDFCEAGADPVACAARNAEQRKLSYSLRQRDLLADTNRGGTADYQRPLVDLVPGDNDPPRAQYTGLWEIVAVTVPDGYEVDAIKHVETLQKALDSKKFSKRHTGKVINCPIVDERSAVGRGITNRKLFYPRIELWYRRQLAFCFLANGWETLGNAGGQLYFADQDALRFDTFAVSRVQVGKGTELAVNVGKAYQPATFYETEEEEPRLINRPKGNLIIAETPRRTANDLSTYTPMRWVFDVPAPVDYKIGTWKTEEDLDLSRTVGTPIQVRNLAVRGIALSCSIPKNEEGRCGRIIRNAAGIKVRTDSTGDTVCNAERDPSNPNDKPLECNPDTCACDAPFVKYGEACGVGIAQCSPEPDSFAEFGYQCFPPWGGFCQRACSGSTPNTLAAENVGKEPTQLVDSRCGGLPGFICYTPLSTCFKFCDQNITAPDQCSAVVTVGGEQVDIQKGQTCQNFGLAVCAWPDTHTPEPFTVPQ